METVADQGVALVEVQVVEAGAAEKRHRDYIIAVQ